MKMISHFGERQPLNHYKMFIEGGARGVEGACKTSKIILREKLLFNCQKIHFSLHPDHHCYSKSERLGRLPYYCKNFFSFHFVSIATLNCNFLFFSFYHHNLIFSFYSWRSVNKDSLFYRSFSCNQPLVWGSYCRDWWRVFSNLYFYNAFCE